LKVFLEEIEGRGKEESEVSREEYAERLRSAPHLEAVAVVAMYQSMESLLKILDASRGLSTTLFVASNQPRSEIVVWVAMPASCGRHAPNTSRRRGDAEALYCMHWKRLEHARHVVWTFRNE
jgi:hypothetical protein